MVQVNFTPNGEENLPVILQQAQQQYNNASIIRLHNTAGAYACIIPDKDDATWNEGDRMFFSSLVRLDLVFGWRLSKWRASNAPFTEQE